MSTSPPGPLSENRRGGDSAAASSPSAAIEEWPYRVLEGGHRYLVRRDPHNFYPLCTDGVIPFGVPFRRAIVSVRWTVDLYPKQERGAVEVEDEDRDRLLAPELEAEAATIAQEFPRGPLGPCRLLPEFRCERLGARMSIAWHEDNIAKTRRFFVIEKTRAS